MALVPCVQCRQPFYASCHDASCVDALCPYCEYGEEPLAGGAGDVACHSSASSRLEREEVSSGPQFAARRGGVTEASRAAS